MSYELSFSPEFFMGDGYTDPDEMDRSDRPTCVWQAILSMSPDAWEAMCVDCFPGVPSDMVDPYMVLERIQETNSCSDLRSPVKVWIDPQGWHSVKVYDSREEGSNG